MQQNDQTGLVELQRQRLHALATNNWPLSSRSELIRNRENAVIYDICPKAFAQRVLQDLQAGRCGAPNDSDTRALCLVTMSTQHAAKAYVHIALRVSLPGCCHVPLLHLLAASSVPSPPTKRGRNRPFPTPALSLSTCNLLIFGHSITHNNQYTTPTGRADGRGCWG